MSLIDCTEQRNKISWLALCFAFTDCKLELTWIANKICIHLMYRYLKKHLSLVDRRRVAIWGMVSDYICIRHRRLLVT